MIMMKASMLASGSQGSNEGIKKVISSVVDIAISSPARGLKGGGVYALSDGRIRGYNALK